MSTYRPGHDITDVSVCVDEPHHFKNRSSLEARVQRIRYNPPLYGSSQSPRREGMKSPRAATSVLQSRMQNKKTIQFLNPILNSRQHVRGDSLTTGSTQVQFDMEARETATQSRMFPKIKHLSSRSPKKQNPRRIEYTVEDPDQKRELLQTFFSNMFKSNRNPIVHS